MWAVAGVSGAEFHHSGATVDGDDLTVREEGSGLNRTHHGGNAVLPGHE